MFRIGEFSQFSQVPVKTLRYYADIGLLPPAHVDRFTGYRYYTVGQLPRLHRILALRDLGFSLEQIGHLLDDDLTVEQMRGMLRLRQAEIEQSIDAERSRLVRVERRLQQIEQEGNMTQYDVVLKRVDAARVASLRDTIPDFTHFSRLIGEMFQYLGMNGVQPAGPPRTIYHDPEFKDENIDVEIAVPVSGGFAPSARIAARELPAVEEMASCILQGSYDHIHEAYEAIMRWIEANAYEICGPPSELYLRGPESTQNPAEYVTEIQIPVHKRTG